MNAFILGYLQNVDINVKDRKLCVSNNSAPQITVHVLCFCFFFRILLNYISLTSH